MSRRWRLAIFSPGGIAAGVFAQGLPAIVKIVERLGGEFEVVFYSLPVTAPDFRPSAFRLSSPPGSFAKLPVRGRFWSALSARFLADHWRRPFDVLMSFWGHPTGTFAVSAAELLGRPSVVLLLGAELASVDAIGYGQLRHPLSRAMVLRTCRRASRLVLVTRQQLEALRTLGVDRDDIDLVPWGADPRMFRYEEKRRSPPLKLLNVANLSPVKDQATLVRAFAILRRDLPAKLRLVGPDFMHGAIHAMVREMNLSEDVELVGPVPYAQIVEHHRWADLFALTSLSEGQNGALTEAVTSGLLAVSTPVGLGADLGEKGAVIVRPGDALDLAAKIRRIAGDDDDWRRRVAHARVWAESHDLDWTVARLIEVVRAAAASVGARPSPWGRRA